MLFFPLCLSCLLHSFLFLPYFCSLFMCCAMSCILKAPIGNWRGHLFYLGSGTKKANFVSLYV